MQITTTGGITYSYIRKTNEILLGVVDDSSFEWQYSPFVRFNELTNVDMYIIALTEQCNLRCTYCCYSGAYPNNRRHSSKTLTNEDIDNILNFIKVRSCVNPVRIAFYGGEPLLAFELITYCVNKAQLEWPDVKFSLTTNGTLLSPPKIDWLISHNVEISISIDGPETFHNRHRIGTNGKGSFNDTVRAVAYIKDRYPYYVPTLGLQMTLGSFKELDRIAEGWNVDEVLHDIAPQNIHGVASNFNMGVENITYRNVLNLYLRLLEEYERHPDWLVLKTFFEQIVDDWGNRPILDIDTSVPMPTCMPINTKLYIDSNLQLGVCEKMCDSIRIGSLQNGINWDKANNVAIEYYNRRKKRCKKCPAVRFCKMCLTALEYTEEQWDILCHNERVYHQVSMSIFCEMAERGLIE